MVLFQDNHKLVEARFVWWVVGWRLHGFLLRVVSGILSAMFSDLFTHFHDFLSWIVVVIGHAETGSGAQILRREIFSVELN